MSLQKSKNWDKYEGDLGFVSGDIFDEGWPRCSEGDIYEIITNQGERFEAYVDFSAQYRAEGKQWLTIRGRTIYKHQVIAWKEKAA